MPGIITHNKILRESIAHLNRKNHKSYLHRSILTLFNSKENLKAGLFGSLGPNIFDYIPRRNKKSVFGSEISFMLHNGNSAPLIASMIKRVQSYGDKRTEWASMQRAYLYGFISHIISDAVFHPFVFYFSGFPDTNWQNEKNYYREQNLLFQYNIDNYYLNYDKNKIDFHVEDMLPLSKKSRMMRINSSVKTLILESIKETFPEIYAGIVWRESKNTGDVRRSMGALDCVPWCVKQTYRLKFSRNKRILNFLKTIRRKKLFFSDFTVYYPEKKYVNQHVLNFHKDRWQYPGKQAGFRYESIENLMIISCEKITDIWEKIEKGLYGDVDRSVFDDIVINAFTGEKETSFFEMVNKSPVKLNC